MTDNSAIRLFIQNLLNKQTGFSAVKTRGLLLMRMILHSNPKTAVPWGPLKLPTVGKSHQLMFSAVNRPFRVSQTYFRVVNY